MHISKEDSATLFGEFKDQAMDNKELLTLLNTREVNLKTKLEGTTFVDRATATSEFKKVLDPKSVTEAKAALQLFDLETTTPNHAQDHYKNTLLLALYSEAKKLPPPKDREAKALLDTPAGTLVLTSDKTPTLDAFGKIFNKDSKVSEIKAAMTQLGISPAKAEEQFVKNQLAELERIAKDSIPPRDKDPDVIKLLTPDSNENKALIAKIKLPANAEDPEVIQNAFEDMLSFTLGAKDISPLRATLGLHDRYWFGSDADDQAMFVRNQLTLLYKTAKEEKRENDPDVKALLGTPPEHKDASLFVKERLTMLSKVKYTEIVPPLQNFREMLSPASTKNEVSDARAGLGYHDVYTSLAGLGGIRGYDEEDEKMYVRNQLEVLRKLAEEKKLTEALKDVFPLNDPPDFKGIMTGKPQILRAISNHSPEEIKKSFATLIDDTQTSELRAGAGVNLGLAVPRLRDPIKWFKGKPFTPKDDKEIKKAILANRINDLKVELEKKHPLRKDEIKSFFDPLPATLETAISSAADLKTLTDNIFTVFDPDKKLSEVKAARTALGFPLPAPGGGPALGVAPSVRDEAKEQFRANQIARIKAYAASLTPPRDDEIKQIFTDFKLPAAPAAGAVAGDFDNYFPGLIRAIDSHREIPTAYFNHFKNMLDPRKNLIDIMIARDHVVGRAPPSTHPNNHDKSQLIRNKIAGLQNSVTSDQRKDAKDLLSDVNFKPANTIDDVPFFKNFFKPPITSHTKNASDEFKKLFDPKTTFNETKKLASLFGITQKKAIDLFAKNQYESMLKDPSLAKLTPSIQSALSNPVNKNDIIDAIKTHYSSNPNTATNHLVKDLYLARTPADAKTALKSILPEAKHTGISFEDSAKLGQAAASKEVKDTKLSYFDIDSSPKATTTEKQEVKKSYEHTKSHYEGMLRKLDSILEWTKTLKSARAKDPELLQKVKDLQELNNEIKLHLQLYSNDCEKSIALAPSRKLDKKQMEANLRPIINKINPHIESTPTQKSTSDQIEENINNFLSAGYTREFRTVTQLTLTGSRADDSKFEVNDEKTCTDHARAWLGTQAGTVAAPVTTGALVAGARTTKELTVSEVKDTDETKSMWKSDVVVAESGKTKAEDIKLASATIITSNTTSKSVTATTLFDKTQLDTVLSKIDSYYFGKIKEVSGVDKSLRGTKGFFNSDETIPPLFLMKLAGSLVESLKMQAFNQNDKIYIEQGTWPDIFVKAIAIYCKSKQLEPGYSGGYEFEQDSLNSKKSLEFVPTKIQADIYKEAIRLEKGPALLEPTDEKSKPKPGFKLGS